MPDWPLVDMPTIEFSDPSPTNHSIWATDADVNAHNAYHGGQISLRKLQGAWNPEKAFLITAEPRTDAEIQ